MKRAFEERERGRRIKERFEEWKIGFTKKQARMHKRAYHSSPLVHCGGIGFFALPIARASKQPILDHARYLHERRREKREHARINVSVM